MTATKQRLALHWQILIAIAIAVVAGLWAGEDGALFGVTFYSVFDFVGRMFMAALKMLIVPLIASSMIVGVAGLAPAIVGPPRRQDAAAVCDDQPGGDPRWSRLRQHRQAGHRRRQAGRRGVACTRGEHRGRRVPSLLARDAGDIVEIFIRMVPENVFSAASDNGAILAVIFFSVLFGLFMTRIGPVHGQLLLSFWKAVFEVMTRMTEWVMRLAPIGVFGLVAKVVAKAGLAAAGPLALFAGCVLAGLAVHFLITLPLLIRVVTGLRPWPLYPAMAPAFLTAFSTASSSATLPVTLDCIENRAGVPNKVASFTVPLGATINMDGTALYECAAVIFIAQAYGVELSMFTQFSVVLLALLTSIGVAGIPAASLVAIAVILTAVGLPPEAIGILFVFDRILDMSRTMVNVAGDSAVAVMVARLEGETGVLGQR